LHGELKKRVTIIVDQCGASAADNATEAAAVGAVGTVGYACGFFSGWRENPATLSYMRRSAGGPR